MSLEDIIKANTEALKDNTAAIEKLLKGGGSAASADKGSDEGSSGRGRGRRGSSDKGDDNKGDDKKMSREDFMAAVKKFMDVESDKEYDKRLEKVIDPVLDKADVKELKDLPEKHFGAVLDNIADYEKDSGGSRRRAV